MTVSINPGDIGQVIEIASIAGTIVATLLFAAVAYFLVRPKKRRDAPRHEAPDELRIEEMLDLMDRMERRLATLERAIADDRSEGIAAPGDGDRILEAAGSREPGRMK